MRYPAVITREDSNWLVEFPDCPGCQTFARSEGAIEERAREALEGWLEVALEDGEVPPRPRRHDAPKGASVRLIEIATPLATAITIREARVLAHLSQADLGARIGVSQQAIAKLERAGNVSIGTLEKVARGLGRSVEIQLVAS